MERLTDEEWLARARARLASTGSWEPDEAPAPSASLPAVAPEPAAAVRSPRCPTCDGRPPLEIYRRYELVTFEPLRYCTRCYGFWARHDALARGVHDPYDTHPALTALPAPARCRLCFGRLKPDGVCRDCAAVPPPRPCPSCDLPMLPEERDGVTLDHCQPCAGLWFDLGEIARVYRLAPAQGLAAATVDETAADEEPPAWQLAAEVLLRMFLPFVPL